MNRKEFAALAATMDEYYGRNQITKSQSSMDIWYELIGDLSYDQCKNAVRQLMATNNFFPSVAEIRKLCTQTGDSEVLSIDDAWGMVLKARAFFRDSYGPRIQEIKRVEALPLGIRQENRDRLNDQIRKAADRLQLGDGRNGEAGRDAGGGAGKA